MGDQKLTSKTEELVIEAISFLSNSKVLRHEHSKRCYRLLEPILYPDEYTVLEVKQSRFQSLSPERIIATNQRLIIAKPSFWGLRTGRNIFSSTKYETIPYNHIISITLYSGRVLSTINIHLDVNTNMAGAEVHGLRSESAKAIFIFLEKMTQHNLAEFGREKAKVFDGSRHAGQEGTSYVDMERARRVVKQKGSRFVWLGLEPLEFVVENLCVNEKDVVKVGMDELERHSREDLGKFENCVFVCYDGVLATHVSSYLKSGYGINSYVLKNGIEDQVQAVN